MKKTYIYRTACGRDLTLRREGNGSESNKEGVEHLVLETTCEEKPEGSRLGELIECCASCSKRWVGPSAEKTGVREELDLSTLPIVPPPTCEAKEISQDEPSTEKSAEPIRPDELAKSEEKSMMALPEPKSPPVALPVSPPVVTAPFAETEKSELSEADRMKTHSDNLLRDIMGTSTEEMVDLDATLAPLGLDGGPSVGGFSTHTLLLPMQCWRKAYYKLAQGYTAIGKSRALLFGQLYHACWELWYKTGGQVPFDAPCDAVRAAGAPKLAGDVQRLIYGELKRYSKVEAETWDIRAVEPNALYFLPPVRIGSKSVRIPLTCRHDLLLAKKQRGEPCYPSGPVASGIYILDHKTSRALTFDITKGYGMDPQFLMNALIYLRSEEVELHGPLNGIIVGVAIKHETLTDRSYVRIEAPVDMPTIDEFEAEMASWAIDLYAKLASHRNDVNKWPKNHSSCVGRYGSCEFFNVCDVGGESWLAVMYTKDEKAKIDLASFASAPPKARVTRTKAIEEVHAKEPIVTKSSLKRKESMKLGKAFLPGLIEEISQFDLFKPTVYLVPGHTEKSVKAELIKSVSQAWPAGTSFSILVTFVDEDKSPLIEQKVKFDVIVGSRGMEWTCTIEETHRGKCTWKAIVDAMCKGWWDVAQLRKTVKGDSGNVHNGTQPPPF